MLRGTCPTCGESVTTERVEGQIACPACAEALRVVQRGSEWIMQQRRPPRRVAPDDRLVWCEIQIAPAHVRLSIVPDQPVLFSETVSGTHTVYLIEGDAPRARFMAGVEYLAHTLANLFALPQQLPEQAFVAEHVQAMSVHVRAACADGRQWAALYYPEAVPAQVGLFIETCREFAVAMIARLAVEPVAPDEALNVLGQARHD